MHLLRGSKADKRRTRSGVSQSSRSRRRFLFRSKQPHELVSHGLALEELVDSLMGVRASVNQSSGRYSLPVCFVVWRVSGGATVSPKLVGWGVGGSGG